MFLIEKYMVNCYQPIGKKQTMNPIPLSLAVCICLSGIIRSSGAILYVNANGTTPVPPYANWSDAATNIQVAVDAANAGDEVLVTNGVYQTGNRLTSDGIANRVVITNSVMLRSVNGPDVTSIDGGQ